MVNAPIFSLFIVVVVVITIIVISFFFFLLGMPFKKGAFLKGMPDNLHLPSHRELVIH